MKAKLVNTYRNGVFFAIFDDRIFVYKRGVFRICEILTVQATDLFDKYDLSLLFD